MHASAILGNEILSSVCAGVEIMLGVQKCVCHLGKRNSVFCLCRVRNNAGCSEMIKCICHLINHKFSQFQGLFGHFVNKKLKIILDFKVIYQWSRNSQSKRCLFTTWCMRSGLSRLLFFLFLVISRNHNRLNFQS